MTARHSPTTPRLRKPKRLQSERAYEDIKWKILDGELEPGRLYTEAEFCTVVGFGRSPVRSAVFRLQHDRIIEVLPRKGMFVRSWSAAELKELAEARMIFEGEVAALAANMASPEHIRELEALLEEGRRCVKRGDRKGLMRIDHQFHIGLAQATGRPTYVEIVSFLKQRSISLWNRTLAGLGKVAEVQMEHEAILHAIKARDPKRAAAAIRAHLQGLTDILY
jgi:DNA-binding GntR family transcriptional regulator